MQGDTPVFPGLRRKTAAVPADLSGGATQSGRRTVRQIGEVLASHSRGATWWRENRERLPRRAMRPGVRLEHRPTWPARSPHRCSVWACHGGAARTRRQPSARTRSEHPARVLRLGNAQLSRHREAARVNHRRRSRPHRRRLASPAVSPLRTSPVTHSSTSLSVAVRDDSTRRSHSTRYRPRPQPTYRDRRERGAPHLGDGCSQHREQHPDATVRQHRCQVSLGALGPTGGHRSPSARTPKVGGTLPEKKPMAISTTRASPTTW